jgi:hypothetical protein
MVRRYLAVCSRFGSQLEIDPMNLFQDTLSIIIVGFDVTQHWKIRSSQTIATPISGCVPRRRIFKADFPSPMIPTAFDYLRYWYTDTRCFPVWVSLDDLCRTLTRGTSPTYGPKRQSLTVPGRQRQDHDVLAVIYGTQTAVGRISAART